MSTSGPNPYVSPAGYDPSYVPYEKPTFARESLDYLQMVKFIFESPNWWRTLLFVTVGNFIPIIGPIVVMGYQLTIVEALYLYPQGRYPDFDFNQFMDYLKRGVWPFLTMLLLSFLIVPFVMIGAFAFAFIVAAPQQQGGPRPEIAFISLGFFVLMGTALGVVMNFIAMPLMIRSGLCQDFNTTLNFGWVMTFIKTMWKEMIIGIIFLIGCAFVAMFGVIFFFVGVYVTMSAVVLAQSHFYLQLYQIFLTRGGEPVPLVQKQLV